MGRVIRVVGAVIGLVALLASAHVVVGGYGPLPSDREQQSLVDALEDEIADGADAAAQQLFPEGAYFVHVLTGIAQARLGGAQNLERARSHLTTVRSDTMLARFGDGMVPEHGIFASGWSLELAVGIAAASGTDDDLRVAVELATEVTTAIEQSPTPYLASYPGQYWPCDSVVAVSALANAADLPGVDDATASQWRQAVSQWRAASESLHPVGTLLPHRTDEQGRTLEGPRGSSQAIIQTFWPAVAPDDRQSWARFVSTFVTRELGLVAVREHPVGSDGPGDVDSGPLVFGVSLSATTVALGAARANGAEQLADDLDHEAEVFGLPTRIGPRRYALGVLPVGEAFLAFARSRPPAGEAGGVGTVQVPQPLWVLWWCPGLVVAAVVTVTVIHRRRDRPGSSRPHRPGHRRGPAK